MQLTRRFLLGSTLATLASWPARGQQPEQAGFRRIEARPAALRLRPEGETPAFGYDGQVPGPVLRLKAGEEARVRLVNRLDQPTSLHWRGVRLDNPMDGVAGLTQQAIAPGGALDYRFTPPDPGFFAFHPQAEGGSGAQIGRGLSGFLIVEEAAPPAVERELFAAVHEWPEAKLTTVNARPIPLAEATPPGARVRLRLVNTTPSQVQIISFFGFKPLVVAIDGQPCDPFEPVRQTIPVGPLARFEIMFDMPDQPGAEGGLILRGQNAPDQTLALLRTQGAPIVRPAPLPAIGLPLNPALPPAIKLAEAFKLDIAMEANAALGSAGGASFAGFAGKPLFSVKRGTGVSLGFVNRAAVAQQVHIHGHHARLLHDLDDGWEPYWRDSILVPANKTKRIAFLADNPGKWAIDRWQIGPTPGGGSSWFEVA